MIAAAAIHYKRSQATATRAAPAAAPAAACPDSPPMAEPLFGASPGDGDEEAGGPETTSKRIARGKACERCRRMKIKCDGQQPVCGNCQRRYQPDICVYKQIEKAPKTRSRREEYVLALEARLNRVETILQSYGVLPEDDSTDASASASTPSDRGLSVPALPLENETRTRRERKDRVQDFWGISNPSAERPEWINDIIHDVVSRGLDAPATRLNPAERSVFKKFRAIPPREELMSLMTDFFAIFNSVCPLFDEASLMRQLNDHLSTGSDGNCAWWATLNIIIAITYICRARGHVLPKEDEQMAWDYLRNALAVQNELPILNADVQSVQALLGMVMFFQMQSCNSQMPSMFIAVAIRLMHSLGLHMNSTDPDLSPIEKEQRKRIFWVAYIFDREISLRTGRNPVQDDDEMTIDIPEAWPSSDGFIDLSNIFRMRCIFAKIQGKVYKQLYSDQSFKKSDGEVLSAVVDLDAEIEAWRNEIPDAIRPGNPIGIPFPQAHHVLALHFMYWHCLNLIHRRGAMALQTFGRFLPASSPAPGSHCLNAARSAVQLLKTHPPASKACKWYILYYCATALVTLFSRIIQAPLDPASVEDLERIRVVLRFLKIMGPEEHRDVWQLQHMSTKLETIATNVMERAARGELPAQQQQQLTSAASVEQVSSILGSRSILFMG